VRDREAVMARRRQGGDVALVAADPLERLLEMLDVYGCCLARVCADRISIKPKNQNLCTRSGIRLLSSDTEN
jgi:type II secretory pathway component PulL